MGLELKYDLGQTPIDEEEKEALLIESISTRSELDEFEQFNIQKATEWVLTSRFNYTQILQIDFIKTLHLKMFDEVWKWAGQFRKSNKNLGVDKSVIQTNLQVLLDDCTFWIENKVYTVDEIAIRFKHRMVSIHPFPNGNGRHSRLCADLLISHVFDKALFSWGHSSQLDAKAVRSKYISALQQADAGNILPLIEFARS